MDVTPQLLHDVEFREAKRGGYNTQDVDDFLERLAVALERQDVQLREARQRVEAAESRVAEAERRAALAEQRASETSDSDDTLKRTLVLAQRTADAAIREAEEQAARTLGSAQEQAGRLLAEAQDASARAQAQAEHDARSAHEEARAQVLAEMGQLEGVRDQLRYDVDLLERHLDGQRSRLYDVIGQLQALLDDPGSLGAVAAPEVSDLGVTAEATSGWADEAEATYDDSPYEDAAYDAPAEPAYADAPAVLEQDAYVAPAPYDAEADHAAAPSEEHDLEDDGPPTQPVEALTERDADDDAYLAELRKAMTDDSPLGPRDDAGDDLFDGGADTARSRFGRRR
jgi:cell division initiation protein